MKLIRYVILALGFIAIGSRAQAQQATQDVTFEVQAINETATTGSRSLVTSSATDRTTAAEIDFVRSR
jgi:hypothetical protein